MCAGCHRKNAPDPGKMAIRLIQRTASLLALMRWSNLVLVAGCLYIFHLKLSTFNPNLVLADISFWSFLFVAILITASGYLINDHFDRETDQINQPRRIERYQAIHPVSAFHLYWVCVILGALLAGFVAWSLHLWLAFFLYPFALVLLYLYATRLKGEGLWGNGFVAGMSAVLPLVLLIPEWDWIHQANRETKAEILFIFLGFAVFSFLISFFRELVKDLEDIQGDLVGGWKTYPVRSGIQSARHLATGLGCLACLLFIATGISVSLPTWTSILFYTAGLLILVLLMLLANARESVHYFRISQGAKIILAIGLLAVLSL